MFYWKPVTDCGPSFSVYNLDLATAGVSALVVAFATLVILGLLYALPAHVFGTSSHKYAPGTTPHGSIIVDFPYGLVRHPAASGFAWVYLTLVVVSGTPNAYLLSGFWIVFIVVGTLVFEEGGLKGDTSEFGGQYDEYRGRVCAFVPSLYSIKRSLGFKVEPYSWEKKTNKAKRS